MPQLNITTKNINLEVVRDGEHVGVISFDPHDLIFVERFYELISVFEKEIEKYSRQYLLLQKDNSLDKAGVPKNMKKRIDVTKKACEYVRGAIDKVFGDGAAQIAFGDNMNIETYYQFFQGVTPHVQQARAETMKDYLPDDNQPASGEAS